MIVSHDQPPSGDQPTDTPLASRLLQDGEIDHCVVDERPVAQARRRVWVVAGALAAAVAAVLGARWIMASNETGHGHAVTAKVGRHDLTLTVVERGLVDSANNVEVRCEVPLGSVLETVLPDGSMVEAGDVIATLDTSNLELLIMTQEIAYERALAAKIQTEQTHAVAAIAVREYLEGTFANERNVAESNIVVVEEALRSAQNILAHNQGLHRKGYVSDTELADFEFAVRKAELDLESATSARDVIVNYTKLKMTAQLESARDAALAQRRAAEQTLALEEEKLTRLRDQLAKCRVVAPSAGMIVHANDQDSRPTAGPLIQEGAMIRERQVIARIPDLTRMQVRVQAHESKVEYLKVGMPARVWIQDREFAGEVTGIDNQPLGANPTAPDLRLYYVYVRIDGAPPNMRTGTTAQAEITVANLKDSLCVPADAVVELEDKFYCWAKTSTGFDKRLVKLGRSNTVLVEVKDGLVEGEEVLLNPRTVLADSRQFKVESLIERDLDLSKTGQKMAPPTFATARRKDLEIDFHDTGLVNSQDNEIIYCLVPNEPLITWIIEDGTIVEAGQQVVMLDSSNLESEIDAQEILVTRAAATRAQAALTLGAAKTAADTYLDGDYRQALATAEAAIAVARENLKTATITLKNTETLARQGFVTELQLEAQRFAVRRAQLDFDAATTTRDTLVNFTRLKMEEDLKAQRDIAAANLRAEEASYKVETAKLEIKREQFTKCTYTAPRAGMVVHANGPVLRMEVGTPMFYARQMIRLPDMSKMQVEMRVHEADIDRLRMDLPATIEIVGQRFPGKVNFVGTQRAPPEDTGFMTPLAPVREFLVNVALEGPLPPSIKPGMTGAVTVHLSRVPRALCVPVDAVVERDDQFYCWIRRGGRFVEQPVAVGQTNLREIEIRDGLAEGDQVVTNPMASIPESRMKALEPAMVAATGEGTLAP